jgi:hypothetical protein
VTSPLIIGGIPADDAKNRARAASLGAQDIPWPAPYRDSVLMECYLCGGRVHVGPVLQKARTIAVDAGDDPPVVCFLCLALASDGAGDLIVLTLTDKKAGE